MGLEQLLEPGILWPLIAGGLISWWIAHRYAVAPLDMKLRQAKRYKQTDFGNAAPTRAAKPTPKTVETSVWRFTDNGNGTVTDLTHKLMWIQAPWGTTWDGEKFLGEPVRITWRDATELFGASVPLAGCGASLGEQDLAQSNYRNGYRKGQCAVLFAGETDWRLPTAFELNTLGFCQPDDPAPGFERSWSPAARSLRERLFPDLVDSKGEFWIWCANNKSYSTAWAVDNSWPPGDFEMNSKLRVLFVRNC